MTDKIVVITTCGSAEEARRIARSLVEQKLAACGNILPAAESIYRWKGAIETAAEFVLLLKTRRELLPELTAALQKLHSYEVPEVIAIPVVEGLDAYLNWVDASTGKPSGTLV